ncbi:MAG TPA: biopolymer transporter ExbD [Usitatibacteraceae bacterium]|nr:biopolymer transporter ExbD [Usitatibacteraceae bacterium]
MNFRRGHVREEPEINFIPLIDLLLVILIFLMVTTTYSKYNELQINLPEASADKSPDRPQVLNIGVDANGKYSINNVPVVFGSVDGFAASIREAANAGSMKDPVVAIGADAGATHQAVVQVMEASRLVGFTKISFTTQARSTR